MSSPITLDTFVSMIAHDLRSPLASIIGYADLLLEGYFEPLTENQAEQVRHIRDHAHRAANLILLLSDVFKLTQGQLTLEFGPTDVHQLLSKVADDLTGILASRDQTIKIVNESASRVVMADGDRLQRALTLLLRLAAQQGPVHSTLHLNIADQPGGGDTVVITGRILSPELAKPGLPPEKPPQASLPVPVFIAQSLLQAHGGRLFWSDVGMGEEFLRAEVPGNWEESLA